MLIGAAAAGRAGSRRLKALLALASPLLILLALLTVAIRPGSDRIQALPALAGRAGASRILSCKVPASGVRVRDKIVDHHAADGRSAQ